MAYDVLYGHKKFSFLAIQRLKVTFADAYYFIVLNEVIGNGSSATIEEIRIDDECIGLKSTITINIAWNDYVTMPMIAKNNSVAITEVAYQYKSIVGIDTFDSEVTHAGNIKATLQFKTIESDNNTMQLTMSIIDSKRNITDVIAAI